MNEQIKAYLEKVPVLPLLLAFAAYLGYDAYTYMTDPQSPLNQKQQQLATVQKDTVAIREKVKKAEEFYRTLEQRKIELRQLALQLEEAKASLSEQMDISSFIRLISTEATKVGIKVISIKPKPETKDEEYYVQQTFALEFQGVFVQVVVFLQRLANLERIIRVGNVKLSPLSKANETFVELKGGLDLNTYRYRGSKADDLGKPSAPAPTPSQNPAPNAAHQPGSGGK